MLKFAKLTYTIFCIEGISTGISIFKYRKGFAVASINKMEKLFIN